MENIRAYKDGNRLVMIIEDASSELESFIKDMLNGSVPKKVEHLSAPKPFSKPNIDTSKMVQLNRPESSDLHDHNENGVSRRSDGTHEKECNTHEAPCDKATTIHEEKKNITVEVSHTGKTKQEVLRMNIFELKDYLRNNRNNELLMYELRNIAPNEDLDFFINVKPENSLRKLALKIAC